MVSAATLGATVLRPEPVAPTVLAGLAGDVHAAGVDVDAVPAHAGDLGGARIPVTTTSRSPAAARRSPAWRAASMARRISSISGTFVRRGIWSRRFEQR